MIRSISLVFFNCFFSFNSSKFTVWEGFSLRWYAAVFRDPDLAEAAVNSMEIAIVSTILSTIVGTACAYGFWKRRDRLLSGALYLSLVTPEIVMGVSLLAFFQWTFRYLHWRLGLHTVILAHVAFSIAYVVVVVAARLRTLDSSLEEAAMDLGATEWGAFRLVTLPALLPGIAAAAMHALAVSFDDYVITSMVAGVDSQTLPMWIYATARRGANRVRLVGGELDALQSLGRRRSCVAFGGGRCFRTRIPVSPRARVIGASRP